MAKLVTDLDDPETGEYAGHWECDCGAHLPYCSRGARVQCPECGRWYEYNYWCLDRWHGDTGTSPLEPRPVHML